MALIDDRGRLFGRLNVIDAAVAVLLLGLIPLAYLGYALFRQPEPQLVGVEPGRITPQVTRVQITGRNLRPFLRVSFNEHQGRTFAMLDTETAEVQIPQLPPGTYDVILYDVAREVSRLAGAVTVEGPAVSPTTQARMLIAGKFIGLDEASAGEIQPGAKLGAVGGNELEVLARGEAAVDRRWFSFLDHLVEAHLTSGYQVPALLDTTCEIFDRRCRVAGLEIEVQSTLPVFSAGGRPLRFVVTDAVGGGPTRLVRLHATFVMPERTVEAVRAGDRARRDPLLGDRVPMLSSVGTARRQNATVSLQLPSGWSGGGDLAFTLDESAVTLDAVVQVRADVTSDGLQYLGRLVRAGAPFVFDHDRYMLRGWIRAVDVVSEGTNGRD